MLSPRPVCDERSISTRCRRCGFYGQSLFFPPLSFDGVRLGQTFAPEADGKGRLFDSCCELRVWEAGAARDGKPASRGSESPRCPEPFQCCHQALVASLRGGFHGENYFLLVDGTDETQRSRQSPGRGQGTQTSSSKKRPESLKRVSLDGANSPRHDPRSAASPEPAFGEEEEVCPQPRWPLV